MRITPYSASFTGKYKVLTSNDLSEDIKSRTNRLNPYLQEVAKNLPDEDTLFITCCNDGLRVGHKSVKKFSPSSVMESDVRLKFSKPISQKEILKNHTSEYILKTLPLLIGKEKFDAINDKIQKETDMPTPYQEYKFMLGKYPD